MIIQAIVDTPAEFPGGDKAFQKYLKSCIDHINVDTHISFNFVVDRNGNVVNIKMTNGFSRDFDHAFIMKIYKMPRWKPAMNQGKVVSVQRVVNLHLENIIIK